MTEIPEFQIAKLRLAPGDVLVMKLAREVPMEVVTRLRDGALLQIPVGTKLMIIDPSIDLSVLTKAEIEARTRGIEFVGRGMAGGSGGMQPPCDTERTT